MPLCQRTFLSVNFDTNLPNNFSLPNNAWPIFSTKCRSICFDSCTLSFKLIYCFEITRIECSMYASANQFSLHQFEREISAMERVRLVFRYFWCECECICVVALQYRFIALMNSVFRNCRVFNWLCLCALSVFQSFIIELGRSRFSVPNLLAIYILGFLHYRSITTVAFTPLLQYY